MKKWLRLLRWINNLVYWELYTPAGNLVCRSTKGFVSEDEALRDSDDFHPPDHF